VWGVLAGVPWIPLIVLVLIAVGVGAWICAYVVNRTRPGDDARVRFLGVLRLDLRRGLPPPEPEREVGSPAGDGLPDSPDP
jgi:hypothetical protein